MREWAAVVVLIELIAVCLFSIRLAQGETLWGFAAVGLLCSALTHSVFISRKQELISIWGLCSFAVSIGCGVRGLLIAIQYPDPETINSMFLRDHTFEDLEGPAAIVIASIALLTLGYLFAFNSTKIRDTSNSGLDSRQASWEIVIGITLVYAAVGTVGTLLYTNGVGGLGAHITARRSTIGGDGPYVSHGQYLFLARASSVALVFLLTAWLTRGYKITIGRAAILGVLILDALAINLVTTTRADVLYLTLSCLAVAQIVTRKFPIRAALVLGVLVIIGIGGLSAARSNAQSGVTDGDKGLSISRGVESGLISRNAYDLSKTLLIVNAVPDILPYKNGATIAVYAFAPIPRAVWANKPVVSPGPLIGSALYDSSRSGVPPGLTGELVWNFGRPFALILSLLIGCLLGFSEHRFRPGAESRNIAAIVVYALALLTTGKAVLGVSVGQAVASVAQTMALIAPLYVVGAHLRARALKREQLKGHSLRRGARLSNAR